MNQPTREQRIATLKNVQAHMEHQSDGSGAGAIEWAISALDAASDALETVRLIEELTDGATDGRNVKICCEKAAWYVAVRETWTDFHLTNFCGETGIACLRAAVTAKREVEKTKS